VRGDRTLAAVPPAALLLSGAPGVRGCGLPVDQEAGAACASRLSSRALSSSERPGNTGVVAPPASIVFATPTPATEALGLAPGVAGQVALPGAADPISGLRGAPSVRASGGGLPAATGAAAAPTTGGGAGGGGARVPVAA
jgi:hypothetical protein